MIPQQRDRRRRGRHVADPLPLQIVVPMAGRGSRFADAGYDRPKPLIEIEQHPMIELVVANLTPTVPHRFVFVALREHEETYHLRERLEELVPGCALVLLDDVTDGAACTVLAAADLVDDDAPLMIANSDQWVDVDIDHYLAAHRDSGHDGFVMTMTATDPKWSFVDFDEQGRVCAVVEKEPVSDVATVGIYNVTRAGDLFAAARTMVAADRRVNGEFYIAPCYQELIAAGGTVGVYGVGGEGAGMYGLGTPDDLELFRSLDVCAEAVQRARRLRDRLVVQGG